MALQLVRKSDRFCAGIFGLRLALWDETTLQISIGWLYVVTSVIPLALKGILPIRIIPIGKIL